MSGGLCPGLLLWGFGLGGYVRVAYVRGASLQWGHWGAGQGCICHDACDWRFMSGAFAQEAFGMGLMSRGFLQGAYV